MKLLIVEDDAALAAGLGSGLLDAGFALDLVHRLADAERSQRVNQYDLIVLDLGLRDGDGRKFLAHLREQGIATPVLILTARGMVDDRVDGLEIPRARLLLGTATSAAPFRAQGMLNKDAPKCFKR